MPADALAAVGRLLDEIAAKVDEARARLRSAHIDRAALKSEIEKLKQQIGASGEAK